MTRFDPSSVPPKTCAYCGERFGPPAYVTKPSQWAKCRHCSISCGRKAGKQRARPSCPRCGGWKSSTARVCSACQYPPVLERLMSKVELSPDGCWLWTAHLLPNGYAQMNYQRRAALAHRVSYELHKGPIPPGTHLDHLCRTPRCVNPDHLEPVTPAENTRRGLQVALKETCANGHPWEENRVPNGVGAQCCGICRAARSRRRSK